MSENLFGLTVAADKGLDDLQCQRLLSENLKYQEIMLQYRCALKALENRLEILNEEFSLRHDRNPIESIKSRLKSPSSIMNKMQKRGLPLDFPTMQANIMDIAGVRVICYFEEDVFFLAKCLKDQSDIEIVTEKDYISNPKPNGYRSLHLTIRLPVFFAEKEVHVPVEIQLRTIAMDFWASLEHGKRCGFSKRYFLVLVACRHLTCTKTECRKMFLSLIAPLTTIRLNRGKRSNRLPYIFAQGQER